MDSSHVALVSLNLTASGFASYKCEQPITFGVSITNLAKVLRLASNDDQVRMSSQDLQIEFRNKRAEKRIEFELNLITLDSDHLGIPETNYASEITMNSFDFTRLCKELHALSETVQIEASMVALKFSVDGEVGRGRVIIETGVEEIKKPGHAKFESVNLSFALRYLNMFNKASGLCNTVKLQLAADTPLVVEYDIDTLGTLRYYLAPKISEA